MHKTIPVPKEINVLPVILERHEIELKSKAYLEFRLYI